MDKFQKKLQFKPDVAHKVYNLISQIDEYKGQWKAKITLSPQTLGRLKKSVIVTSTGASTRIEGSQLTDKEIDRLLNGLKIKKFKTRDEQEVVGYAELLKNIFDSHGSIKLNESSIRHFHSELLKYSEKDQRHRGNYKFGNNRVEAKDASGKVIGILFDPTPPHLVAKEMNELVEWTNLALNLKEMHPLIVIGNFIFEFLSIHPFQDGNGRISRILTNLLLLKAGYGYMPYISHEKLIEYNKNGYYLALNKSQKGWKCGKEDIQFWLMFFLNVLLEQSRMAISLLNNESIDELLSEKQLMVWNYVQENKIVTPRQVREALKLHVQTTFQILNKLLKMNRVRRLGEGSGVRYLIHPLV